MQVAALAVTAVLCASVIRRGTPEVALLLILAAGTWIVLLVLGGLGQAIALMERLSALAQLDEALIAPVGKTVVLSILTKITGELCRSAGEGGAAAFVEVAGTLLALTVALPLVESVVTMILKIVG